MANGWTPERKARQAELIYRWKPWERGTGPKTPEGKARSAMRGYKGGERQRLRELRKALREAEAVVGGLQTGSEAAQEGRGGVCS